MNRSTIKKKKPITGAEIQKHRTALGMDYAELAELLGVKPNTIYRWETGRMAIGAPGAIRLALESLRQAGK
jgi:DNA-binding transcriptional regulator YiaG